MGPEKKTKKMSVSETKLIEEENSFGSVDSVVLGPAVAAKASLASGHSIIASSCRICLSSILSPARLVCGHKFCESCLNKYWKANEEPEFVVCPLCRDFAFKIGFTEKEHYARSTRDFRMKFDPNHKPDVYTKNVEVSSISSMLHIRIWPLIMPIVYFLLTYVKPVIVDLLLFILE